MRPSAVAAEGQRERGVLNEDRPLQLLQRRSRLEPELVGQECAGLPIDVEPLRLTTRPVQGEHELGSEALAVGMLRAQGVQLGNERKVTAESELRVDTGLGGCEAQLVEPIRFDPHERLELEIGQRAPLPQGLRRAERRGGPIRVSLGKCLASVCDEALELLEIKLARLDPQQVPGCASHEPGLVLRRRRERLPQSRDVVSQRVVSRVHALLCEKLRDQPVARDDAVRAKKEQREQRPLLRTADGHRGSVHPNRQRAEHPELETDTCHRSEVSASRDESSRGRDPVGTGLGQRRPKLQACSTPRNASGPASARTSSGSLSPEPAAEQRSYRRRSCGGCSTSRGTSSCSAYSSPRRART